jgi:hypothetical protein
MKKFILSLVCFAFLSVTTAQNNFTISGIIKDKSSGETLIGATVQLINGSTSTIISNTYGYYSLSIPQGTYTLVASYVGYKDFIDTILVTKNRLLDIELSPQVLLQEIVITSKKKDNIISNPLMGVQKINVNEIKSIPVLLGEKDILKTIQLLPGIKSAGEGNSGFYVRGGTIDQNLILLDEAPVYNSSHLLGFFSTFNSDAIKDVAVYKGGMPAQYGGRLSSVVDVKMNEGNNKEYKVSGGLGLIASRLNIEGPIQKEKSSFIVSGRRTYADMFLALSSDSNIKQNRVYFYDLNVKFNFKLSAKDKLFISGYFGTDFFKLGEQFSTNWGNKTGTIRWNHIFNPKLFSNTSIIFSNYSYQISIRSNTDKFNIDSKIEDFNLKQDFDWYLNRKNKLKFGFNIIRHTTSPGAITAFGNSNLQSSKVQDKFSTENAIYINNEWKATSKLNIQYGARLTAFNVLGGSDFFTYDENGTLLKTTTYKKGEIVKTYWNFEPRFSASYSLNNTTSFKIGYNRSVQNLHLLSNSTAALPTDLWIPSSNNVKPEIADQIALGYFKTFNNKEFEFSVETYYKSLLNQIDYRDGSELRANNNVESELLYGSGRAYGIEFLFRKNKGKLNGWIGYTLSKTERKFDKINSGNYYPAKQDRTHDLSIVAIYNASKRWTLSSTFVYNTGNAVTFPSGKYNLNGNTVFLYTERNGYRMPAYHRLDFAATLEPKEKANRKIESSWTFGLYNVYGRENAYSISFRESETDPNKTEAVRTSLFRFVPSITWNFKF